MSDWIRFTNTWGTEAKPIDAASCIDLYRNDVDHLQREPPTASAFQFMNGDRTSNRLAYDQSSVLYRQHKTIIHGRATLAIQTIKVALYAKITGGNGTLRLVASPAWRVAASPAVQPDLEGETSPGAITSATGQRVTITLVPVPANALLIELGGQQGTAAQYFSIYLTIQGRVNNVANTMSLMRVSRVEGG